MKKTVQTPWLARRSYGRENSWIGEIDFGMNLSIWKVLTMLMFLLCFANGLCLHFVFSRLPWQYQKLASAGKPYIDTENTDFTGVVTDVATDGTYIYCAMAGGTSSRCWMKKAIILRRLPFPMHTTPVATSD